MSFARYRLRPVDRGGGTRAAGGSHPPPLRPAMLALLRCGDVLGRYQSGSEVVQALALGACNAGWSQVDLYDALTDRRNVGGEKVQEILGDEGECEARRYVALSWEKAAKKRAEDPPVRRSNDDDALQVERVAEVARCAPWTGLAGSTDSAVIEAHVEIARRRGNLVHGASVREVAERAGVAYPTASRSQGRLIERGWLIRLQRGEGNEASTWLLAVPEPLQAQLVNTPSSQGRVESVEELRVSQDSFRHGALGKTGCRVMRALAELGSVTASELVSALPGMHRSTGRRHLLRFERLGLAALDESGRWRALAGDLDAVARRLGTAGKGDEQHAAHEVQREMFRSQPWVRRLGGWERGRARL